MTARETRQLSLDLGGLNRAGDKGSKSLVEMGFKKRKNASKEKQRDTMLHHLRSVESLGCYDIVVLGRIPFLSWSRYLRTWLHVFLL